MADDDDNWSDWCERACDNLDAGTSIIHSLQAAQASLDAVAWPLIEYANTKPTDSLGEAQIMPMLRGIAEKAESMAQAIENRRQREE